jgi:hypothetical protein
MNETPKNLWNKPLQGARGKLTWFGLLTGVLFLISCAFCLVTERREPVGDWILWAFVASAVFAAVITGLVAFIRWLCCWRNVRRFAFSVVCVVTFLMLALAVENWRGRSAWQAHRRALEAKGEKFGVLDVAPPAVPDEKNFALSPLLRPIFEFTNRPGGGVFWQDTNAMPRLEALSAQLDPKRHTNDQMVLGKVDEGTFADFSTIQSFYRDNTNYPQAAVGASAAETALTALSKFDNELAELRAAASARPASRFPIRYTDQPPWGILLPHLAKVKTLTLLADIRATALLEAGRPADSLEDLKLAFRLSDSIHDEPLLIDHLVRVATVYANLQVVREGLVRHAWNDAQLTQVMKQLEAVNLLAEYKLSIRGERNLTVGGLDYLRRLGFHRERMFYLTSDEGGAGESSGMNFMPSGWFYQNMLRISEIQQEYSLAAADEKAHRVYPDITTNGVLKVEAMGRGPYTFFVKMLLPATQNAVRRSARVAVAVDSALVACALEKFRLAQGKLPETLDALVPQFLPHIPVDVIDGKPLRYRLKPDGSYVVYSVGWDETDNGGELSRTLGDKNKRPDLNKGDWVWLMPARLN